MTTKSLAFLAFVIVMLSITFVLPNSTLAISYTPSWDAPELITTEIDIDRMEGQDRFMDFDHFGVAGLAVPSGSYWRRLPVAGWTRQFLPQPASAWHTAMAYDRSERPVIVSTGVGNGEVTLYVHQLDSTNRGFSVADPIFFTSGPNLTSEGTAIAVDPLGRIATASSASISGLIIYQIDDDGDGQIEPEESYFSIGNFRGVKPSLDFDQQARPYIGFINHPLSGRDVHPRVMIGIGDVGIEFGTAIPDPTVTSSYVSLAVNPLTGFPAVAYNDIDGNALKYSEWDGQAWSTETVVTQSAFTSADNMPLSLAFDPADGRPAIAYSQDYSLGIGGDPPTDILRFAWHDGNGWNSQTVDSRDNVAAAAISLSFNEAFNPGFGDGLPAIAYISGSGELRYIHDPPLSVPEPEVEVILTAISGIFVCVNRRGRFLGLTR